MTADCIHVFYTDSYICWYWVRVGQNQLEIGEAEYTYRKADAVDLAKQHGVDAHIFGRNGLYQRTIKASA